MKIKLKVKLALDNKVYMPGEIIDMPSDSAQRMIAEQMAEPAEIIQVVRLFPKALIRH